MADSNNLKMQRKKITENEGDKLSLSLVNNKIDIVLVKPQMSENVGAVARVMSNFGLHNLVLVNPREQIPNDKAIAMATHGDFIFENVKLYKTFSESIEDAQVIFGSTANARDMKKKVLSPKEAAKMIYKYTQKNKKVAVVFGKESHGLTNSELNICHYIITIPTHTRSSSMNIAQSVCVIAYEIYANYLNNLNNLKKSINTSNFNNSEIATKKEVDLLFTKMINLLTDKNFFRIPNKETKMQERIYEILIQGQYTSDQLRILHGIINVLTK